MFPLEIISGGANHKKGEHLGLANARLLPTAVCLFGTLMTTGPYKWNLHIAALASYPPNCLRILCTCTHTHTNTNGERLQQVIGKVKGTNRGAENITDFGHLQKFPNVGYRPVSESQNREPGRTQILQAKTGVITLLPENATEHVSEPAFVWGLHICLLWTSLIFSIASSSKNFSFILERTFSEVG